MWIFENFYWILIIGFAVISALSKSGKSRSRQNPRGMPTFGGGGHEHHRPRAERDSRTERRYEEDDDPTYTNVFEESERKRHSDFPGTGRATGQGWTISGEEASEPEYRSEEGESSPWGEPADLEIDTLEKRDQKMQREIEKMHASLDRIASTMDKPVSEDTQDSEHNEGHPVSPLAEKAREGILWAEILGPPRSKRPYNGRS